ncbi:hypothetical protein ABQE22_11830 [Enterococcus durans]|uniref:hypothetical protein n=2 Tax=Enterococcus TaxID=1350 RepID=UPI00187EC366|nr:MULTISPECIES: hypothetical protein [Enterococcus]MBE8849181.1 hypothetical protein [Enterococcus durans]MBE8863377.1 hypothetical protein [Enterococcus faecium]MDB1652783.1 hypothetical protein [Enterococcus durans]MDB1655513.1 hypothetical protein [Enterococcus durans]MDB1664699.1 hypothetical protein [Enterococcus durans]
MTKQFPKAVRAENLANVLKVEFEDGSMKFIRTHWVGDMTDSLQFGKRGKGKRKLLLTVSRNMWIGSNITIEDDGTVVLNGKDRYTPEELWHDGSSSMAEL